MISRHHNEYRKKEFRKRTSVCGPHNGGYTLLEVILALALSVLLIGGISVAINYHLIVLRQQQEEIERAQIARQSLFLITKDIRAAIQYKPIETSALNELIESVSAATDISALAEQAGIGDEMVEDSGLSGAMSFFLGFGQCAALSTVSAFMSGRSEPGILLNVM